MTACNQCSSPKVQLMCSKQHMHRSCSLLSYLVTPNNTGHQELDTTGDGSTAMPSCCQGMFGVGPMHLYTKVF